MQEIEAKFYINNTDELQMRLQELDALLIQERVLETNIRFDLPGSLLRSERRVLRLRQDSEARLTYKSPSKNDQGVLSRTEIEFTVEDFDKAKQFLEALGYQPFFVYEKYRTTYELNQLHIMLDELPFGHFVEIEGERIDAIRICADVLGLQWDTAITKGYQALFEQLKHSMTLPFRDLTFENFKDIKIAPAQLDVHAADDKR